MSSQAAEWSGYINDLQSVIVRYEGRGKQVDYHGWHQSSTVRGELGTTGVYSRSS